MERDNRKEGFTLIELLTVIAIIGILGAILIPVLSAVRENARKAQCMSNMRQVALAVLAHESDHGTLPGPIFRRVARPVDDTPDYREINWNIDEYVGPRSSVFNCPTNTIEYGGDLNQGNLAFLLNNKLSTDPPRFFGYPGAGRAENGFPKSLEQIVAAGRGPVARQASEMTRIWMISDVDGLNYSATNIGTSNPEKPMADDALPVHDRGRNFVFFDGHGEYRKMDDFPGNP